jgi:hypothetical protein
MLRELTIEEIGVVSGGWGDDGDPQGPPAPDELRWRDVRDQDGDGIPDRYDPTPFGPDYGSIYERNNDSNDSSNTRDDLTRTPDRGGSAPPSGPTGPGISTVNIPGTNVGVGTTTQGSGPGGQTLGGTGPAGSVTIPLGGR